MRCMADNWSSTDNYLTDVLIGDDPALSSALEANAAAELPPIDVSAPQGKFLHLLARIRGARRVLEIGTLGGYSTIWLARAVGESGRVVTLEYEPRHAEVARANLDRAGVGDRVDIRVGPALDSLPGLVDEDPFDLVFIDATRRTTATTCARRSGCRDPAPSSSSTTWCGPGPSSIRTAATNGSAPHGTCSNCSPRNHGSTQRRCRPSDRRLGRFALAVVTG